MFKRKKKHKNNIEPYKAEYYLLFLPLNGIFIDKIYSYKQLAVYPVEPFKVCLYKSGKHEALFKFDSMDKHPALKEYNIACKGKDDGFSFNGFFTMEAAGDQRLLMNPVLTYRFYNMYEDMYYDMGEITNCFYAVIRYFQYKISHKKLIFNFEFLAIKSPSFSFCDEGEHKLLLPGRFQYLASNYDFLNEQNIEFFFSFLEKVSKDIHAPQKTKSVILLNFYNELWEHILERKYYLLIVKVLAFLSNYFEITKMTQLPFIFKKKNISSYKSEEIERIFFQLIKERNNYLHENTGNDMIRLNYNIKNCDEIFGEKAEIIHFILSVFDELIREEVNI